MEKKNVPVCAVRLQTPCHSRCLTNHTRMHAGTKTENVYWFALDIVPKVSVLTFDKDSRRPYRTYVGNSKTITTLFGFSL